MAKAQLYRMSMPKHLCPFGQKSLHLLKAKGYEVEDHELTTREATDAFMREHDVKTTPQTFIDGKRIGGYDDLRAHFDMKPAKPEGTTYEPVIAIFGMGLALAIAVTWVALGTFLAWQTIGWFISISMCLLALQKLRDVEGFTNGFLNYDLLAQKWVPYAYVYPWAEAIAGVLMTALLLTWISAPLALFIGTVGAVSVIKAVWIDKRELKCACVGGDSNVPLGFISLTENVMMAGMGLWMLVGLLL
ncbi:glutaredoxin family protein [Limimaricola cinnabarinus]|uniref:Methylamine utilization protein MauE n=1 Tax=Limimaricola cinnabarinus LL-001 TaxID=1337093 RepID=U2Z783_9RHOB|nr:glutaredoxin family protein [Limimaricola cinnabarinus]GAD56902.1 hypothetical protein MBELCI_2954 [Limimaricola cinnabarinus LL-001]